MKNKIFLVTYITVFFLFLNFIGTLKVGHKAMENIMYGFNTKTYDLGFFMLNSVGEKDLEKSNYEFLKIIKKDKELVIIKSNNRGLL
ncbi:MAG: hypothetical protein ACK5LT_05335 [Lachnospirales bacterium]